MSLNRWTVSATIAASLICVSASAGQSDADRWIQKEFQPSSLNVEQQRAELRWFVLAADRLRLNGIREVRVISEDLATHHYEANVLAKAFTEITGIRVVHEIVPEGTLVSRFRQAMDGPDSAYDGWVTDSDLIGTHYRYGLVESLTDYMKDEGRDFTSPTLDLKDFIGLKFTTGPDGQIYQLPDQQFANLYWFRADWFAREDLQKQFRDRYGYPLGVPLNWSAYEDIAEFFSVHVRELDGKRVYGHMDYGARDPSLGWRFTDAWLSMAGVADKGLPNGLPVDEWGIRVAGDQCTPVGASVGRGGATDSPAAIYALSRYLDWLNRFAPPEAKGLNFTQAGPVPGQGQIAQQIFWYTGFTAALNKPGLPVTDAAGKPRWRMAPSPHGAYWKQGMQNGYQDVGSWTFLKSTPRWRKAAAWLYAQFVTSRTVSLKKSITGLTFIRESDIRHPYFTEHADQFGGLIEFYRSPARIAWTPTGTNVPDYPKMAELWWRNIGLAVDGKLSPAKAMEQLARQMDDVLGTLQRQGMMHCTPKLNAKQHGDRYLTSKGAPWQALQNEKPPGETIPYERLLQAWKEGRLR